MQSDHTRPAASLPVSTSEHSVRLPATTAVDNLVADHQRYIPPGLGVHSSGVADEAGSLRMKTGVQNTVSDVDQSLLAVERTYVERDARWCHVSPSQHTVPRARSVSPRLDPGGTRFEKDGLPPLSARLAPVDQSSGLHKAYSNGDEDKKLPFSEALVLPRSVSGGDSQRGALADSSDKGLVHSQSQSVECSRGPSVDTSKITRSQITRISAHSTDSNQEPSAVTSAKVSSVNSVNKITRLHTTRVPSHYTNSSGESSSDRHVEQAERDDHGRLFAGSRSRVLADSDDNDDNNSYNEHSNRRHHSRSQSWEVGEISSEAHDLTTTMSVWSERSPEHSMYRQSRHHLSQVIIACLLSHFDFF